MLECRCSSECDLFKKNNVPREKVMPSIKKTFINRARDNQILKEFFVKNLEGVGFSDLEIQKTPLGTRVTVRAARPGLVIGKKGSNVKMLTQVLATDFDIENPQIDVEEVRNPELNAQIMAERLANALEKGQHYRRAGYGLLRRIMRTGAEGCEIVISGKITSQRARYQKMRQGIIKRCGEPVRDLSYGIAHAKLKAGILGIRVKILPPDYNNPKEIEYIGRDGLDPDLLQELKDKEAEAAAEQPIYEEEGYIDEKGEEVPDEEEDEEKVDVELTDLASKRLARAKFKGQITDDDELADLEDEDDDEDEDEDSDENEEEELEEDSEDEESDEDDEKEEEEKLEED